MSDTNASSAELTLATFNLTKEQVAWVNDEATRRVQGKPGSKPNRSDVAREVFERSMRLSESNERLAS